MLSVVSAPRAAALDAWTIAQGVPARALMQRAGAAAAGEIARRFPELLARGVLVLAGPGNNGGDGWVVARALRAAGVRVRVASPAGTKTPDAVAERALYEMGPRDHPPGTGSDGPLPPPEVGADRSAGAAEAWPLRLLTESLVVDALLGTGATGGPRGAIAEGIALLREAREAGATIVAVDLPSALDATTGDASHCVPAHLTLTFGTLKRGHLVARGACGAIAVLDIGLVHDGGAGDPNFDDAWLADARFVRDVLPSIGASAHKGTRGKLAIIGGAEGMAGAAVLAARAAMRSGVGMVKLFVAPESLPGVQEAEPAALAAPWPNDASAMERELDWADAVVLGPGLGRSDDARRVAEQAMGAARRIVVDADALNLFAGDIPRMRALLAQRESVITPHPAEAARLLGIPVEEVLERRWEVARALGQGSGAVALLKGVPTILSDGATMLLSAAGTPVLATAGSGDVLSGIVGTLLIQSGRHALEKAAAAAWVHGRAAERLGHARVRGLTIDSVLDALPAVWAESEPRVDYPVLAELPAVGGA